MNIKNLTLLFLLCAMAWTTQAQDTLIMHNGRRIPISKLKEYNDGIEVKHAIDNSYSVFPPDSIFGYSQPFNERSYFLKTYQDTDSTSTYLFLERLEVGKISLYQYTKKNLDLYIEKEGQLIHVFNSVERKSERFDKKQLFISALDDDEESVNYVRSSDFKMGLKSMQFVLSHYNKRNFEEGKWQEGDLRGMVYLYRTPFQKTKDGIKVTVNGERHYLYINDYIGLSLSVTFASKLHLTDGLVKSTKVLSGELENQYFEVRYDKKSDIYIFDKKGGTELHFEFNNIKDKVDKKE